MPDINNEANVMLCVKMHENAAVAGDYYALYSRAHAQKQ
jgi:hypothetical protein